MGSESRPTEQLSERRDALQETIEHALGNKDGLGLYEVTSTVIDAAATYADIIAVDKYGLNEPHKTAANGVNAAYAKGTLTGPEFFTVEATPAHPKFLNRFQARYGLAVPKIIYNYLEGIPVLDNDTVDYSIRNGSVAYDSRNFRDQIYAQSSRGSISAVNLEDTILLSKLIATAHEYVRDRLSRFDGLGQDTRFLPRRMKTEADISAYWLDFLIGNRLVIGVLPAFRFRDQCAAAYKTVLASLKMYDTTVVDGAVRSLVYLQTSERAAGEKSSVLRQPLIDGLFSFDQKKLLAAYEDSIMSHPALFIPAAGQVFGLSDAEFTDLQKAIIGEQTAKMTERAELIASQKLARQELDNIYQKNADVGFVDDLLQSFKDKRFVNAAGQELTITHRLAKANDLGHFLICFVIREGDRLVSNGQCLATTALGAVMHGRWFEPGVEPSESA